jgi:hypothetical protein
VLAQAWDAIVSNTSTRPIESRVIDGSKGWAAVAPADRVVENLIRETGLHSLHSIEGGTAALTSYLQIVPGVPPVSV